MVEVNKAQLHGVQDRLSRLVNFRSKEFFSRVGMFAMTRIKQRTEKGQSYEGTPFKPYSEGYKLFRQELGFQTNAPDLFLTGTMMGAMTYDAKPTSVKLFFRNNTNPPTIGSGKKQRKLSQVSSSAKAYYNHQTRPFFKLNEEDIKKIVQMLSRELDKND